MTNPIPFITTERNVSALLAGAECLLLPPKGNKPPCAVGDVLAVQESLWVSDDGQFYAMESPGHRSLGMYDAVTIDGQNWWFGTRYSTDGTASTHYVKHIAGYHNLGNRTRPSKNYPNGQWKHAFRLYLTEGDATTRDVDFHNRLPAKDMPKWAHRCTLTVSKVESLNISTEFHKICNGTPMSAMTAWGRGDGLVDPKLGNLWRIWFKNVVADGATIYGEIDG